MIKFMFVHGEAQGALDALVSMALPPGKIAWASALHTYIHYYFCRYVFTFNIYESYR